MSQVTEKEIASISVAPRVTESDVEDFIQREEYHTHGVLTFCILHLKNGFTTTGQSSCASPANYNKEIGDRLAKKHAVGQIWPLLGFLLADKLHLIRTAGGPTGLITKIGDPVTYVGTKVIHAVAMTRDDYNILRGWEFPADENGDDNGYLVQYADGGSPNVAGFDGYVSWSPWDVFERTYSVGLRLEPETFLTRLEAERDRTVGDLAKLTAFLESDGISKLSETALEDLRLQKGVMTQLAFILSKRYDDLMVK